MFLTRHTRPNNDRKIFAICFANTDLAFVFRGREAITVLTGVAILKPSHNKLKLKLCYFKNCKKTVITTTKMRWVLSKK